MLIETELKANDVVSFKLSSGEEIISRFDSKDDTKYIVKNPMVIIAGPQGLGMTPFMFSVSPDSKYTLSTNTIMCAMKTEGELAKQYIAQVSGLVL